MDENTLKALESLATKLGTTAEHLWGVLLRQAPISGAIDLFIMIAFIVAAVEWSRFVRKKTKESTKNEDNRYPRADWSDEVGVAFAWGSVFLAWLIVVLVVSLSLSIVIAAFLNPEYWALRQLLDK